MVPMRNFNASHRLGPWTRLTSWIVLWCAMAAPACLVESHKAAAQDDSSKSAAEAADLFNFGKFMCCCVCVLHSLILLAFDVKRRLKMACRVIRLSSGLSLRACLARSPVTPCLSAEAFECRRADLFRSSSFTFVAGLCCILTRPP